MSKEKISLKSKRDIDQLKEGGKILSVILSDIYKSLKPGLKGKKIEERVMKLAKKNNASCSFYHFENYPAHLCLSINDEIVHGIPSGKVIKEGDIVSVDMGIEYKKLFTDSAFSIVIPKSDNPIKEKLVQTTFACLKKSLDFCRKDYHLGDIGHAIQSLAESRGFSVVRKLVGHGVGYGVHEAPLIPNTGEKGKGIKLKPGMVIAIEPMLCVGSEEVKLGSDKWTFKTKDSNLSAHFEWTVAITDKNPVVITPLDFVNNS